MFSVIFQFSIFLTIVLIGELIMSVTVYHMGGEIEDYALNQMNESLPLYNTTTGETYTKIWNLVQSEVRKKIIFEF